MTGREHSTTKVTAECSGHGVRTAGQVNCRTGELQDRWSERELPVDWEGVTMENGRVVKLVLQEFGLTGAVPAEIGQLSSLERLYLAANQLTSLPAEIGQLTSLTELHLRRNELTTLPAAAIRELRAAGCHVQGVPNWVIR